MGCKLLFEPICEAQWVHAATPSCDSVTDFDADFSKLFDPRAYMGSFVKTTACFVTLSHRPTRQWDARILAV